MRGTFLTLLTSLLLLLSATAAGLDPSAEEMRTAAAEAPSLTIDEAILRAKQNMMSAPSSALIYARMVEDKADQDPGAPDADTLAATGLWLQAEALNRLNRPQDALPVADRGLERLSGQAKQSKLYGDLILVRGRIARNLGNQEAAFDNLLEAHDLYSEIGEARYQAIALQSIGDIYQEARDYDRVLHYYSRADEVYSDDPALALASYNNRAQAYTEIGRFDEAVNAYRYAFAIAEELEAELLQARIRGSIGATLVKAGRYKEAIAETEVGLAALPEDDGAAWEPLLLAVIGDASLGLGDVERAESLFERAFADTDLTETGAILRDAHEAAYKTFEAAGRPAEALAHLEAFKRLDDAGRDIAAKTNNVLKAAEFDFAAQALKIEKLNTERLLQQVRLGEEKAKKRRILVVGGISIGTLIAAALLFGLVVTYRSHRRSKIAAEQLAQSNEVLEKANQMKTEFLATTSHEIRTPLNGILGLTEVMMEDERLPGDLVAHIKSIHGAGDTLRAVVNDILDVSTIESGQFEVKEGVTELPRICEEVIDLFRDGAKSKNLELIFDPGDCPAAMLSDPMRVRQVMFNLLSNATKFTLEGSVRLSLQTIHDISGEDFIAMSVSDTGIGIPADQHEAIFETFHQLDNGRTRQFGGTGLGLAICKRVIEAMGGSIIVRSTVGAGSKFTVRVPYKPLAERAPPTEARPIRAIQSIDELDVLVVEDNPLNRTVIQALISKHVSSITMAEDGVQALAVLKERHFDVILMDKQMPNMDGITATKMIRAMSDGTERSYIVAVTADAYEGSREELLGVGMDAYLSKPVTADDLRGALTEAINSGCVHEPRDGQSLAEASAA